MTDNQIKTKCNYKSIPAKSTDWMAWRDGEEEGPIGYGKTEDEAIKDLQEYD